LRKTEICVGLSVTQKSRWHEWEWYQVAQHSFTYVGAPGIPADHQPAQSKFNHNLQSHLAGIAFLCAGSDHGDGFEFLFAFGESLSNHHALGQFLLTLPWQSPIGHEWILLNMRQLLRQ